MNCNLKKNGLYALHRVTYNVDQGLYTAYLSTPPASCPEGVLTSHKAQVVTQPGLTTSSLSYDSVANRPVITVPSASAIETLSTSGPSLLVPFLLGLLGLAVLAIVVGFVRGAQQTLATVPADDAEESYPRDSRGRFTRRSQRWTGPSHGYRPPSQPQTVVVNQGGNDGLVTGMLLGEALSDHHHDREVIHEREVIRETEPSRNDDSYSSSDDSYSSDSSDSGSFSSDSGGDYGSFGSDSGGSDFGGGGDSFGGD